jgi:hypothetical protein
MCSLPSSARWAAIASVLVLAFGPLIGCAAASQTRTGGIPLLAEWEQGMQRWGRHWGAYLADERNSDQQRFKATYYDAQRVFYQIADYTGETSPWYDYAEIAEALYEDGYCARHDYRTAGWQRFPHGLYEDWRRTGDENSRHSVQRLRDAPAFSNIEVGNHARKWRQARYSREIAYAIHAQLLAERTGAPRQRHRLEALVDTALHHLHIWRTGDFEVRDERWRFRQPFMFGLTGEALIAYYQASEAAKRPDKRIPPALAQTADWFWDNLWEGEAFAYVDRDLNGVGRRRPAPDLNLLIAPVYAWLYYETGELRHRERADAIFAGGVRQACLKCSAKIFNQNYRWSFDYVAWRLAGDGRWLKPTRTRN